MSDEPTFLSLCAGIGGLDLGLERAGWRCIGQVEIDPFCQAVLAHHWPDVPRWDDIRTFPPVADSTRAGCEAQQSDDLRDVTQPVVGLVASSDSPRGVDLICAGFPCQPVSHAGRRRAQADERWLWPEIARIVRVVRPRFVLLENVPGLLSAGLGDVLSDLAALGFNAEWGVLSAADMGAPHLRERVFIVAVADAQDTRREARDRLAVRRCAARSDASSRSTYVADAEGHSLRTGLCPSRSGGERRGRSGDFGGTASERMAHADSKPMGRPTVPRRQCAPWQPESRMGGEPHGIPARMDGRALHRWPAGRGEAQYGWEAPRVARGIVNRSHRLRALGNAVVPQCAEVIGRAILATLVTA